MPKFHKKLTTGLSTCVFILIFFTCSAIGSPPEWEHGKEIGDRLYALPVPFIENRGQIEANEVMYYANTFAGTLFVTREGALVYTLPKEEKGGKPKAWVFKENLVSASVSAIKGENESVTEVNCFKGTNPSKWQDRIPTYNQVSLGEVYKGIELKLRASGKNIEKLFYVQPGGCPEHIQVKMEGTQGLKVNKKGMLELQTGLGAVRFTEPYAYQEIGGEKVDVSVCYNVDEQQHQYGFKVGPYDKSKPLIIDPLIASTFLGGSGNENIYAFDLDPYTIGTGLYVAGRTYSSDFPTTVGAYDPTGDGGILDAFVSRLSTDLTTLISSTYLGGRGADEIQAIVVTGWGDVYVAGATNSADFPTTPGAYDRSFGGIENIIADAFVAKLSKDLTTLVASTYLGGGSTDGATCMALEFPYGTGGSVYVAGSTHSTNFPTTEGAYDRYYGGSADAFVSKLSEDLSSLEASTFYGWGKEEYAQAIVLGPQGRVWLTGHAEQNSPTYGWHTDVLIVSLTGDLKNYHWGVNVGGETGEDIASSIAIDSAGTIYVAGTTSSSDFPTTPDAYDQTLGGDWDAFVLSINENHTYRYSTFLGGEGPDEASSLTIDNTGKVYVAGKTYSSDFPTTSRAYDTSLADVDAFVSLFNTEGTYLVASTLLGGADRDEAGPIMLDGAGNVYVAGRTSSSDFPTTPGAYDRTYADGDDAFVSKLDSELSRNLVTGRVAFVTGDFNGDGQDDLAGLNTSNQIWYTTNLSTWNPVPGTLKSLAVGDFNNDGQDDLAGVNDSGLIYYTTNLTTWTQVPGILDSLVAGDFNNDGQDDLAGLNWIGEVYYTLDLNNWHKVSGKYLKSLVVGDFDNDGDDDLAGLNDIGFVYFTTNLGTWTTASAKLENLVVGDFNNDGQEDLAGYSMKGHVYYTNNLATWTQIPGTLGVLASADFNGDGYDDLAGITFFLGHIYYTTDLDTWTHVPGVLLNMVGGNLGGNNSDDLAGLNPKGQIFYTTDMQNWIQIPGKFAPY